jgi:phage-related tail fiber protein
MPQPPIDPKRHPPGFVVTDLDGVLWLVLDSEGNATPNPDGQAISRTTYPELWAVIGETFGKGDGATTFNIPDFRGRVVPPRVHPEDKP